MILCELVDETLGQGYRSMLQNWAFAFVQVRTGCSMMTTFLGSDSAHVKLTEVFIDQQISSIKTTLGTKECCYLPVNISLNGHRL